MLKSRDLGRIFHFSEAPASPILTGVDKEPNDGGHPFSLSKMLEFDLTESILEKRKARQPIDPAEFLTFLQETTVADTTTE